MPGFNWKRFLIKLGLLTIVYFLLFLIIHLLDVVPYLDKAFTGDIETTDLRGVFLLSLLRLSFYIGIPALITLFFVIIADRSLRAYFRSLIETINIFYSILMFVKFVYFFSSMDKAFGVSILDGVDMAIFIISLGLNIICYKMPYFMFFKPRESEENSNE